NGAGKSSLLRVVSGILRPTTGSVLLAGEPVADLDRRAVARRLAVMPQASTLPFATRVEPLLGLAPVPHAGPVRCHRAADRAAVVHDLGVAGHFFQRVVVLDRGLIVADDVPDRALDPERIRDVFGVDPALVRLSRAVD